MDFKKIIRDRYNKEVQPTFDNKHWDSFLAYRHYQKDKRRRRSLILLVFIGLALVGVSLSILITSGSNSIKSGSLSKPQIQHGSSPTPVVDDHSPMRENGENVETKQQNTSSAELSSPDPVTSSDSGLSVEQFSREKTLDGSIEAAGQDTHLTSDERSGELRLNSNIDQASLAETKTGEIDNPHRMPGKQAYLSSRQRRDSGSGERNRLDPIPMIKFSIPLNGSQIMSDPPEASSPIHIPGRDQFEWKKNSFSALAYAGLAFPFHVKTVEEQAHQFGGRGYYYLGKRIRSKVGVEFSLVNFIANEMDPRIGVEIVESPSDRVMFSEVIVESLGLNIDAGLDFLVWRSNAWSYFAGISYTMSTELMKEMEYAFEGEDDDANDDDIFLSVAASRKYFEPALIKFETGISYETVLGGFNISVARPFQIRLRKTDLLDQLQINFGLTHRF